MYKALKQYRFMIFLILGVLPLAAQDHVVIRGQQKSYLELKQGKKQQIKEMNLADILKMKNARLPMNVAVIAPPHNKIWQKPYLKGVLITYHSYRARHVAVAGNFNAWRKQKMHRNKHGVWFIIVEPEHMKDAHKIYYRFNIDDIWTYNPLGPREYMAQYGSVVSYAQFNIRSKPKTARTYVDKNGNIKFHIFLPQAKRVSVAGTFNGWNMWHDFLRKKTDGSWELTLTLPPGEYLYRFYVDDAWKLDLYNPHTRMDHAGKMASFIRVPPQ